MRILLIEDEAELARWLSRSLARHAGFVVEWADDGLVAERRLAVEEFDAVIIDLGLPGMDGHTLLAKIRARDDRTPVLVLTARDSLAEKIGTLHEGADDFLPKPFVVEELEARLIALVRRSRGREHPRLTLGNLVFETSGQKFTVSGQALQLSPREHAVLRVLIQKSGEPINKQQILPHRDRRCRHQPRSHRGAGAPPAQEIGGNRRADHHHAGHGLLPGERC
jgi:two-component system response regulator TctD